MTRSDAPTTIRNPFFRRAFQRGREPSPGTSMVRAPGGDLSPRFASMSLAAPAMAEPESLADPVETSQQPAPALQSP
jgi:hypothetical protein